MDQKAEVEFVSSVYESLFEVVSPSGAGQVTEGFFRAPICLENPVDILFTKSGAFSSFFLHLTGASLYFFDRY